MFLIQFVWKNAIVIESLIPRCSTQARVGEGGGEVWLLGGVVNLLGVFNVPKKFPRARSHKNYFWNLGCDKSVLLLIMGAPISPLVLHFGVHMWMGAGWNVEHCKLPDLYLLNMKIAIKIQTFSHDWKRYRVIFAHGLRLNSRDFSLILLKFEMMLHHLSISSHAFWSRAIYSTTLKEHRRAYWFTEK